MSIALKLIIICVILFIGYVLMINLNINIKWSTILIIIVFSLFINYLNQYTANSRVIYFILSLLFYCIFIYLVYTNDYINVTSGQNPWYIIGLISSVFLFIGGVLFEQYRYFSISIFILIGIILFLNYFLKYLLNFFIYLSNPSNTSTIHKIVLAIVIILGIILLWFLGSYFYNTASTQLYVLDFIKVWWGYIYNYIEDIIIYLEIQYEDIDGYEVLLLLFFTILLIGLLFYKQLYRSFIYWNDGTYLIKSPVILSEETALNYKPQFQYEYAISVWVWFNSTHSTNHTVPILDYGECPLIEYNTDTNKVNIIFLNQNKVKTKIVSSKVQMQKWNHIVINNVGGTVDVFMNGTLIKTVDNVVPINSVKNITVGSTGGISGGLSNLMYFDKPLTIHQINEIYSYTPKY